MAKSEGILLTAFEPSGDQLGAAVISRIKRDRPTMPIWAFGGPKMQAAGAALIESTTEHAAMLVGAASQVMAHRERLKRLTAWLGDHAPAVLVPIDSPAANWSVCKLMRRHHPDSRIVHLVAPQLWAWASWRIHRMRRLSDHALCLLPFEPTWFERRGVKATFVGHPLLDPPPELTSWTDKIQDLPQGAGCKLALLPGSRMGEIKANWPTMVEVLKLLESRGRTCQVVVAAFDDRIADAIRVQLPSALKHVRIEVDQVNRVLAWADVALVVSGTATLHAASFKVPMTVLYNVSRIGWHFAGRWLVRARTFSLPNLISEDAGLGRVVREFVPHFGDAQVVADDLDQLITDPDARGKQHEAFDRIMAIFSTVSFHDQAAASLLDEVDRVTR